MLYILLILILLSVFGVLIYSAITGWKLTHPSKKPLTTPAFSSFNTPKYEKVTFLDKEEKVKLSGWYFRALNTDKAVILAHGYESNRQEFKQSMITSLVNEGYNVLAFDFRNCGESNGTMTTVGYYEKLDLLGAIDYVKTQNAQHIALLGFSMGASTSILAGAESPYVDGVIADSPFDNLGDYLNKQLPVWSHLPSIPFNRIILFYTKIFTGLNSSAVSPIDALTKLSPRPLLLIHSVDDNAISVENSQNLFDTYYPLAGENAEIWKTSGVGHVGSYDAFQNDYMTRVLAFLSKAMSG
jgi:fermentation-respiration switch protein FrsA (DUF1100 family)